NLPPVVLKRMRQAVEQRRDELTGVCRQREESEEELVPVLPVPSGPPRASAESPAKPPWRRLEELLAGCKDVGDLSAGQRINALIWYGQTPLSQLQKLPATIKLALARFLRFTGKNADAVTAYRRFLEEHPQDPDFINVALEAGHFAAQQERPDEARWF